jgi:hypothetical protein
MFSKRFLAHRGMCIIHNSRNICSGHNVLKPSRNTFFQ